MKKILFALVFIPFLSNAQIITTIGGSGTAGSLGDGASAITAQLNNPADVICDLAGNVYIADFANNKIRKITTSGIIYTIAGTGTPGYSGDGGAATAALLHQPCNLFFDATGTLFFADYLNHCIRKINTSGIISTVAGTGTSGFSGDGGLATLAQLSYPPSMYVDVAGNVYISDANNQRIRKVNTLGIISTIAGTGVAGYFGDGGPATAAHFYDPYGIILDGAGNIYIADQDNNRIRKIDATGIVTTFAGTGTAGYFGDGGAATLAKLKGPTEIFLDASGNFFIADRHNFCIRKINTTGNISTIVGTGVSGFSGDGGPATSALASEIPGIWLDASGTIYLADMNNNRVRKVSNCVNGITDQPKNDTIFSGGTAKYWVRTAMPSPIYQWQEKSGTSFVNITNVLPYTGVTTDTLTIHSVPTIFNNSYYRCVISNGSPCVDTSSSAILIVHSTSNVSQLLATSVNVYPNPAFDKITIQLPDKNKIGSVHLINQVGQLLSEHNISGNSSVIGLDKLPPGMYILRILYDGQIIYKKFFKQ